MSTSISLAIDGSVDLGNLGLKRSGSRAVASSGALGWVDPFVGLRVRHQLAPGKELQFLGDVGGFGVGRGNRGFGMAIARRRHGIDLVRRRPCLSQFHRNMPIACQWTRTHCGSGQKCLRSRSNDVRKLRYTKLRSGGSRQLWTAGDVCFGSVADPKRMRAKLPLSQTLN